MKEKEKRDGRNQIPVKEREPNTPLTNPPTWSLPISTTPLDMASTKFSYQRLRTASGAADEEEEANLRSGEREVAAPPRRSWWRLRRRLSSARRGPRIRIPALRRVLRRGGFRVSWVRVWKRLKESRSHLGDLFAGNYMFMQVSPSPTTLGLMGKPYLLHHHHGLPYKIPLQGPSFA